MNIQSAKEWFQENDETGLLIDVRTPLEFSSQRALKAINYPLDQLDINKIESVAGGKKVGLLCQSGGRATKAYEKLMASSLDLVLIEGGTQAWVQSGLPTYKGKKVISLERQVRITAGFIVLSGIVISKTFMPGAEYVSAFVGAGLVFAGITDSCAMGLLIAKMPWNQKVSCEMSH